MPRVLSASLDELQLRDLSQTEYRFFIYDIVSTRGNTVPLTVGSVVLGGAESVKMEFTDYVEAVSVSERGSNPLDAQVGADSIRFRFIDPVATYDPISGSTPNWLKEGNVVRLYEGSEAIPFVDWANTFTGTIAGRPSREAPDRSGNSVLDVPAEGRTAAFLKLVATSISFPQGTSFQTMMIELATTEMGLSVGEFDFGVVGQLLTDHVTTQFVDQSPLQAIAQILFVDGFVPRFDGEGILRPVQMVVGKSQTRTYVDQKAIQTIGRPFNALQNLNSVVIKGLDANATRIFQAAKVVAKASLTLGFFGGNASIKVVYSDDGSILVNNPELRVRTSVTGALVPFGSERLEFTVTDTDPTDITIQGASEGRIKVGGAFFGPLVIVNFASRIAASFIPDSFAGLGAGSTIPVGRIIEGVASIAISLVEATIGRGDYEIIGTPYEYVLQELVGRSTVRNLPPGDERVQELENQLITTQAQVDSISMRELRLVRKRANARDLVMRQDLKLVPDDAFVDGTGASYIISGVERTLKRGQASFSNVTAFETTVGVNP